MTVRGGRPFRRPAAELNPVQMIVGRTNPDGPCHVCEHPLTALGPDGTKSVLIYVAAMDDPDDNATWFMAPLHQWCAPKIKPGRSSG